MNVARLCIAYGGFGLSNDDGCSFEFGFQTNERLMRRMWASTEPVSKANGMESELIEVCLVHLLLAFDSY